MCPNGREASVKIKLVVLMLLVLIGASSCSTTGTGINARIEIASAPAPPPLAFIGVPQWRYLPDLDVYVLADDRFEYDMFRVGGTFYLFSEGYWYRASDPRGPYVAVEVRHVPDRILRIDDRDYHWRRHPQAWRDSDHDRENDRH
jgi:hypothetical protein